ncbi:anaerobic ribonucleoside-triphosphate reductase activating protein [Georgenia sp. Z1344]|uniref:anaerobic ribonucleoside-triphosphate reductase activating protein n=1 Tax=Georgenia sp. Z1344 TaxID=3416706 RepID=UPI003CF7EFD4
MSADDLELAGLVPLSGVDWPDHLVATVFTQGCPWACGYCQNVELIDPRIPGQVPWERVRDLLGRRRGLLDGVVFSGGEATRQPALLPAVREVHAAGLGVGLHTAGAYPDRLAAVLPHLEFLGLDVKAMPEDYPVVVGRGGSGRRAWRSLELALAARRARPLELEVRLTVHPGGAGADRAVELARRLDSLGVPVLALQEARARGTTEEFGAALGGASAVVGPGWFDRLTAEVRSAWPGELRVRPA